jgi:hypothetical protein
MRPPDPAVVVHVGPAAIGIEVFGAPNIIVIVLNVITKTLGQVAFAIVHPVVPGVRHIRRDEFPVTRIRAFSHKFSGAPISQNKPGCFGVDTRASTVAGAQAHSAFARDVDAIEAFLFRGERRIRRVNLEIFVIAIKPCQAYRRRAFNYAQRYTLVAQGDDLQNGVCPKPHEVSSIDLNLEARIAISRHGVALDKREIKPRTLPVGVPAALEIYLTGNQTNAHYARLNVVILAIVSIICGARDNGGS